jgi:hypothetical protein
MSDEGPGTGRVSGPRARLGPLVNGSRPRLQGLGFVMSLHPRENARVALQQADDGDAVTTEQALEEREGTAVQRLRLRILPLLGVETGEALQGEGGVKVLLRREGRDGMPWPWSRRVS